MARLVFDGLTYKQAQILGAWFEAEGEQFCVEWFQENKLPIPSVDVSQDSWWDENPKTETVILKMKTNEQK